MNNTILKSLGITTILAFLAIGVWRAEILYRIGWAGLSWLYYYLISPWIICFLVILAVLMPFHSYQKDKVERKNFLIAFGLLYAIGIISFHVANMYLRMIFFNISIELAIISILNGVLFYFIMNKFITKKIPMFYSILVVLAVGGPIFQSSLFEYGIADGVKTGYPFFFVVFNLGVLSTFVAYYMNRKTNLTLLSEA